MFARLRLSGFLVLAGTVMLLSLLCMAAVGTTSLETLRIGSPMYQRIVDGKDLVADILPPPAYVIEPYLEATLALDDPRTVEARAERLVELRRQFDARMAYWRTAGIDDALRQRLVGGARETAIRFFSILDSDFLPALRKGDLVAAREAYDGLTEAYGAHRAVIDQVVLAATRGNAALEAGATAEIAWQRVVFLVGAVFAAFVTIASLLFVRARVVAPIEDMTAVMTALAEGNTHVGLRRNYDARRDEIGAMARTLETFAASAGLAADVRAAVDHVRDEAAETVNRTSGQTAAMTDDAVSLAESAQRVRAATGEATEAAHLALSSTNTIAAATEQLTNSIREIALKISTVAATTSQAVDAGKGAHGKMTHLSSVVSRIAEVVTLIGDIADRTNLLALNATIEAARAGQAGKGFAVVANEVKNLAAQTTASTDEIRHQIEGVLAATRATVEANDSILGMVREIDGAAAAIAAVMQQQSAATEEIARNANRSLEAVKNVDEAMTTVGSEAETTLERADSVKALSLKVGEAVGSLGGIVVRIVRSTTDERIDRRHEERFRVDAEARTMGPWNGAVRIRDISRGGANLAACPALAHGSTGILTLKDAAVPFVVLRSGAAGVQIKFTEAFSPAFESAFTKMVAGRPAEFGSDAA